MDIKEKEYIDSLSYEQLLSAVRFAPIGDPLFQGEREIIGLKGWINYAPNQVAKKYMLMQANQLDGELKCQILF